MPIAVLAVFEFEQAALRFDVIKPLIHAVFEFLVFLVFTHCIEPGEDSDGKTTVDAPFPPGLHFKCKMF